MAFGKTSRSDRIRAVFCTVAIEGLIFYALITAFWVQPPNAISEALKVITLAPPPAPSKPPPPPPPAQIQPRPKLEEGAASPPNIKSKATDIAAPKAEPLLPPPLPAAEMPNLDYDATSGASDVPGPGTGSGGIGQGTGSGRGGYGPGGGGRGGSPPRHISGRIRDSDYPPWAGRGGVGGTVTVIYAVEPNGRADDCRIMRSSGSADLDDITCRLIEDRFRFRPALDAQGRPVRARLIEDHSWIVDDEFPRRRG